MQMEVNRGVTKYKKYVTNLIRIHAIPLKNKYATSKTDVYYIHYTWSINFLDLIEENGPKKCRL